MAGQIGVQLLLLLSFAPQQMHSASTPSSLRKALPVPLIAQGTYAPLRKQKRSAQTVLPLHPAVLPCQSLACSPHCIAQGTYAPVYKLLYQLPRWEQSGR